MQSSTKATINSTKDDVIVLDDDVSLLDDTVDSLDSDLKALGSKESTPEQQTDAAEKETVDKYPPRAMRQRTPKPEVTPATKPSEPKNSKPEPKPKADNEKKVEEVVLEEEEEEGEEEYEIERIEDHHVYKGKVVSYEIKWKGYPTSQNTVEKANMIHTDVYDLCAAYWDNLTHTPRPSNAPKSKSTSAPEASSKKEKKESNKQPVSEPKEANSSQKRTQKASSPTTASKRQKTEGKVESKPKQEKAAPATKTTAHKQPAAKETTRKKSGKPTESEEGESLSEEAYEEYAPHIPDYMTELGYKLALDFPSSSASWNRDVTKVCVQASPIDRKKILCYVEWNNGNKTIHPMKIAHQKIPQMLIKYYEDRLQFL